MENCTVRFEVFWIWSKLFLRKIDLNRVYISNIFLIIKKMIITSNIRFKIIIIIFKLFEVLLFSIKKKDIYIIW